MTLIGQGIRRVRVICDAESHSPKVVKVDNFDVPTPGSRRVMADGRESVRLDEHDQPVDLADYVGTARRPATRSDGHLLRERRVLECRLCGLRVELTRAKTESVATRLADSGVAHISLASLAAIV